MINALGQRTMFQGYQSLITNQFSIFILLIRWTDPTEAAVEQAKSFEVDALQLHPDRVTVHLTIEHELILRRTLKCEVRFPLFALALRKCQRVLVDRNAVMGERIVRALKRHAV